MPADRHFGAHPGGKNGSNSSTGVAGREPATLCHDPEARGRRGLAAFLLLSGCSGDKAKDLLETAEFEERQMNLPHAKQLYEEVIRLYPSSPQAQTARERLAKLNAG